MPDSRASIDRASSRLVTGRASRHLTYTTLMLSAMLVLVVGVLAFLGQQYGAVRTNLTSNQNVHYIQVTYRSGNGELGTGALRFGDRQSITRVGRAASKGAVAVIATYRLPFGITSPGGNTYYVSGISGRAAGILGVGAIPDATAFGTTPSSKLELDVPVVMVDGDGGMSSDRLVRRSLAVRAIPSRSPIAVFQTPEPTTLFVNEPTFARLVSTAYDGLDWTAFQRRNDSDASGFQAVTAFYVHVEDLADVDAVGRALEQAGYATNYTLRAFDDLAGTVSSSVWTGLAVMVAGVLLCLVLVFTNLQSYLSLARRDMGILKHIGYSDARVCRIYRYRLQAVILRAGVAPVAALALTTVTLLRGRLPDAGLVLLIVLAMLGLLYLAMALVQLPSHVRRPVLVLLKLDRQFE